MSESLDIIRGVTLVDAEQHVAIADYRPMVGADEEGVHVIEVANGYAAHLDRIMVFGRWITSAEHERRKTAYAQDPESYAKSHIKSLV